MLSTNIRHRAKTDFLTSYEHNCALRNTLPVKYVLSGIGGDTLIADVSKIRTTDWTPLLQSIGTASTLLGLFLVKRVTQDIPSLNISFLEFCQKLILSPTKRELSSCTQHGIKRNQCLLFTSI